MSTHALKTVPAFFERVLDGSKTFEIRKDDRGYQTGDTLLLREWDPEHCYKGNRCRDPKCLAYTGRELTRSIGFTFKQGFGCDLGEFVVLSLLPVSVLGADTPRDTK